MCPPCVVDLTAEETYPRLFLGVILSPTRRAAGLALTGDELLEGGGQQLRVMDGRALAGDLALHARDSGAAHGERACMVEDDVDLEPVSAQRVDMGGDVVPRGLRWLLAQVAHVDLAARRRVQGVADGGNRDDGEDAC